jgi:hypothetical protein
LSDINNFYKHLKKEAVCFRKLMYCFENFLTLEKFLWMLLLLLKSNRCQKLVCFVFVLNCYFKLVTHFAFHFTTRFKQHTVNFQWGIMRSNLKENCKKRICRVFIVHFMFYVLCFVDRASWYNRVNKNQLTCNAQIILGIFRQPLHVLGVSRPIIRRYNRMYTTIGSYYSFLDDCLLSCLDWIPIQPGQQTVN